MLCIAFDQNNRGKPKTVPYQSFSLQMRILLIMSFGSAIQKNSLLTTDLPAWLISDEESEAMIVMMYSINDIIYVFHHAKFNILILSTSSKTNPPSSFRGWWRQDDQHSAQIIIKQRAPVSGALSLCYRRNAKP